MWFFWLLAGVAVLFYLGSGKKKKGEKRKGARAQPLQGRADAPAGDGEGRDAWEGSFYDAPAQRTASRMVRIRYRDGDGSATERVVHVRAFEPQGGDGLVIGRCYLRNATRTFRFDRMQRVVDEETGEIIPDLQKALNAEWEASPAPVMDLLYAQHHDVLKLLLYMAKADGAMRAAEVRVIAQHCADLTGDARITPDMIKTLLSCMDAPTIVGFTRTYNKLRREQPEVAQSAAQACRAIVATQKTVHPSEQAALDVLAKPLPAVA